MPALAAAVTPIIKLEVVVLTLIGSRIRESSSRSLNVPLPMPSSPEIRPATYIIPREIALRSALLKEVVTISREYGSGGGEIASRLARRLEWNLIDHAIVERVASEIGTSREEAAVHDEHAEGALTRALTLSMR